MLNGRHARSRAARLQRRLLAWRRRQNASLSRLAAPCRATCSSPPHSTALPYSCLKRWRSTSSSIGSSLPPAIGLAATCSCCRHSTRLSNRPHARGVDQCRRPRGTWPPAESSFLDAGVRRRRSRNASCGSSLLIGVARTGFGSSGDVLPCGGSHGPSKANRSGRSGGRLRLAAGASALVAPRNEIFSFDSEYQTIRIVEDPANGGRRARPHEQRGRRRRSLRRHRRNVLRLRLRGISGSETIAGRYVAGHRRGRLQSPRDASTLPYMKVIDVVDDPGSSPFPYTLPVAARSTCSSRSRLAMRSEHLAGRSATYYVPRRLTTGKASRKSW